MVQKTQEQRIMKRFWFHVFLVGQLMTRRCAGWGDCEISLPHLEGNSTGTQLSPQPHFCIHNTCSLPHGSVTTVNVEINQICSRTHSSEFSVRGDWMKTWIDGDPYLKEVKSSCVGLETDTFFGNGIYTLGIDYDVDTMLLYCDSGTIFAYIEGHRREFTRRGLPTSNVDGAPPVFPISATIAGIETLKCGSCSPLNEKDVTLTVQTGKFNIVAGQALCNTGKNPVSCGIPNTFPASNPAIRAQYIQGTCVSDLVRLVGKTLDISAGDSAVSYPDTFPQIYNLQGTCITLQMTGTAVSADANGLTLFGIQGTVTRNPSELRLTNSLGFPVVNFRGSMTPNGDGPGDPPPFDAAGVERIECGTCDANKFQ